MGVGCGGDVLEQPGHGHGVVLHHEGVRGVLLGSPGERAGVGGPLPLLVLVDDEVGAEGGGEQLGRREAGRVGDHGDGEAHARASTARTNASSSGLGSSSAARCRATAEAASSS
ncbi:hypothetical protein GCM10009559_58860 [Pseudonocardia zijingensis]|uniref:Uncharacterized protein n=1 Tax=Pseudonocardia zijingensis TaxID=153376 RepID=A0ABN1N8T9_9PSEU